MNATLSLMDDLKQKVSTLPKRVIFPEQSDRRVIEAIKTLQAQSLCEPVLLSPSDELEVEVLTHREDADYWYEQALRDLTDRSGKHRLEVDEAREALKEPLLLASVLLRVGYVDAGVAGSLATTADVLRAAIKGVGLAVGTQLVSSTFLMEWPDKVFTFGDCAVNPRPNAQQLAQIAIDSAASHFALTGEKPKVGLLSFSTNGSAQHEDVTTVRQALALVREQAPDLDVDGELQFDAALLPTVAAKKAPGSPVAGDCNVFIFPNLGAGNIAYKITERLAGANAIGPVLQGTAKPWLDLSRGCSTEDIVNTAVIGSLLAHQQVGV
jgi:phosphate acetyltransferase